MGAFADTTIDELPLDAVPPVPWWNDPAPVTLERILVHVLVDLARHVGHADILREQIDGAAPALIMIVPTIQIHAPRS